MAVIMLLVMLIGCWGWWFVGVWVTMGGIDVR